MIPAVDETDDDVIEPAVDESGREVETVMVAAELVSGATEDTP